MTINAVEFVTLEDAIDTMAEIILGPVFAGNLREQHARARVQLPMRFPEYVYTEDMQTPSGYPCCELVAINVHDDSPESRAAQLSNEIAAEWTVNGDDEQRMGREIKRLIAATRATFRNGSLGPNVGGSLRTGDVDFGPVLAARSTDAVPFSARYVKSASIQIFWQTVEG